MTSKWGFNAGGSGVCQILAYCQNLVMCRNLVGVLPAIYAGSSSVCPPASSCHQATKVTQLHLKVTESSAWKHRYFYKYVAVKGNLHVKYASHGPYSGEFIRGRALRSEARAAQ